MRQASLFPPKTMPTRRVLQIPIPLHSPDLPTKKQNPTDSQSSLDFRVHMTRAVSPSPNNYSVLSYVSVLMTLISH